MTLPTSAPDAKSLGLKTFFNGKPCKKGHVSARYTSDRCCVDCARSRAADRYENNRSDVLEQRKASYLKDQQAVKHRVRDYAQRNPEKIVAAKRNYYLKHRVRLIAYSKRWREENAARADAHRQQWIKDNPDKVRASIAKVKSARALRKPHWLTLDQRNEMRSLYAEARRMTKESGITYSIDHVVPLLGSSVSGLHVPWNLQIMTMKENRAKWNHF